MELTGKGQGRADMPCIVIALLGCLPFCISPVLGLKISFVDDITFSF